MRGESLSTWLLALAVRLKPAGSLPPEDSLGQTPGLSPQNRPAARVTPLSADVTAAPPRCEGNETLRGHKELPSVIPPKRHPGLRRILWCSGLNPRGPAACHNRAVDGSEGCRGCDCVAYRNGLQDRCLLCRPAGAELGHGFLYLFDLCTPAGFEPALTAPERVAVYASGQRKRARRCPARAHIGRGKAVRAAGNVGGG
jgi:hypothetical protein